MSWPANITISHTHPSNLGHPNLKISHVFQTQTCRESPLIHYQHDKSHFESIKRGWPTWPMPNGTNQEEQWIWMSSSKAAARHGKYLRYPNLETQHI